ncbi:prolyl oligopeptidase family serine peptidase [Streptomyces sp. VNUA24]|uniref:S9 family peptidase n=1 Tax=Streptomyces sp. VNUA24 TaxID=3031131 RepID=UPI0023B84A0D|nr:prolyl oligopeptidase family serine peptidase [Streptomyces sp. VNUA24]WEH13713.1 prolyl oligopeptidase family serine peptidase [Streptomyces sp. VNUA24]
MRETQNPYPAADAVSRPLPGRPSRAPSRASVGEDAVDGVPWRVEEHGTASAAGVRAAPPTTSATVPAPSQVPLPDSAGPLDTPQPLRSHGCWYPSVDPSGAYVAFICDRGGVPQLWSGPVGGDEVHLLDSDPHPVKEVAWSPDGRWIAYTTAPGGGEHTRVLCVRPDGTGRHILAGAEPGSSAYLGCWQHDGSALAVTVAEPVPAPGEAEAEEWPALTEPGLADPRTYTARRPPGWAARDGRAVLLGGPHHGDAGPAAHTVDAPEGEAGGAAHGPANPPGPGASPASSPGPDAASSDAAGGGLAAYLVDPLGVAAPALLAVERGAATLRVCDISRDGRLALVRRGPRGRREALVVRTTDLRTTFALPVADGDPWIGRFSPDGATLWLRSDASREFAALFAVRLDPGGERLGLSVAAEREDCGLELLAFGHDGRTAALSWNVRGASELEVTAVTATAGEDARTGPRQTVALPHEVVTRIPRVGGGAGLVLALSGSQRRPGVWWFADGTARRTPWSSRDEDAVPPGRPPVRPVPLRLAARDGLPLNGWYYRAPGRGSGVPAPCVLHLHGGPEEQERPVFNPLYHELLGQGVDVFAPDVRGSSGHGRSFVDADLGTGRFAAIEDVADCAAHVVLSGLADPRRLAVMGRSYGGYLVMASLVWHPDLFRTGVAACGMSDFATFYAGTEPWIAESAAHKYGHPEHDRALLRALSPMTRVDALRVPVLTVHGEHDTNVPLGESEQFVRAARERGLEAELLMLRDEGHDFLRADSRRLFRRTAADWIQRHIAE